MKHYFYTDCFMVPILPEPEGDPGDIVRDPGELRDVGALLRMVVGLLSCGQFRKNGTGAGGETKSKHGRVQNQGKIQLVR